MKIEFSFKTYILLRKIIYIQLGIVIIIIYSTF